jgi:ribosomal protein L29
MLVASLSTIDFFKLHIMLLDGIQKHEADAIAAGFALILAGNVIDLWISDRRSRRKVKLVEQRMKTVKGTVGTAEEFMDDFLTNMRLFRAELSTALSEDSLDLFDELVQQAGERLDRLRALDNVHISIARVTTTRGHRREYPEFGRL